MANFSCTYWQVKRMVFIYIGLTNELERRVGEHKEKILKGFTQKYNVDKLMCFEEFDTYDEAFTRER